MNLIKPIVDNEGDPRVWRVLLDGVEYRPGKLEITGKYGHLAVGIRPEGFQGWLYQEPGGGGAATLPWVDTGDGSILVGLLMENRPNMGEEPTLCIMGGMADYGESHAVAQVREASEEGGLDTTKAVELPGLPIIQDRLFFVANVNQGEGVHMYHLELKMSDLERNLDQPSWKVRAGTISHKKESELWFFDWKTAITHSADGLALAAIARLMAYLSTRQTTAQQKREMKHNFGC